MKRRGRPSKKEPSSESAALPNVVNVNDQFLLTIIDNKEFVSKNLKDNGFTCSLSDGSKEIWFDFDKSKKAVVVKIPLSRSGDIVKKEFTITQLISIFSKKKQPED